MNKEELTKRQQAAIVNLEKAIERIGKNGLVLQGMDTNIHAFRESDYQRVTKASDIASNYIEAQKVMLYVYTGDVYRDSGGW